jgi:hypothetical protein
VGALTPVRARLPLLVVTLVAALLVVPATYSFLRAYDVLVRPPEPNPATIVWSAHIAMFWRLWIGAYMAGMVTPLAYVAARKNLGATVRVLSVAVVVIAGASLAQGLLMP